MTEPIAIQFRLNGEPAALPLATTVATLLGERGLRGDRVAVEVNGAIVPRSSYAQHLIEPGDVVEIVSFVGGG